MQYWWESVELASRSKTSQDIFQHLEGPSDDVLQSKEKVLLQQSNQASGGSQSLVNTGIAQQDPDYIIQAQDMRMLCSQAEDCVSTSMRGTMSAQFGGLEAHLTV